MTNQFRSRAFVKIKHTINKAHNSELTYYDKRNSLIAAREMLENATSILTKDEISILMEYMLLAWDTINPVAESFADEMDTMVHKKFLS